MSAAGGGAAASGRTLPPALAGSNADSAAIRAAARQPAYSFVEGPDKAGEHSHAQLGAETFSVRGPRYLADRVKVASAPATFDLMHVDLFKCLDKIGNAAARRDSWLRAAREAGDSRFYVVVNYVTPASPFVHLIIYFAVQPERVRANPAFASLWERFTAKGPEGDAFRNERWKVIPRIAEGPWLVSSAVGTKPALLATKLTHTWILADPPLETAAAASAGAAAGPASPAGGKGAAGGGASSSDAAAGSSVSRGRARGGSFVSIGGPGPYLEIDCDVASSSMAFMLVSMLQSQARHLVIDLGFAIEPREEDSLPEVVLGAVRLSRIDLARAQMVAVEAGDGVLGAPGATHAAPPTH